MRSGKILIISHDASLNGAPITLLRLMRLLHGRGYRFNTLIRGRGILEKDFRELSDVFGIYKRPAPGHKLKRVLNNIAGYKPEFDIRPFTSGIDLVLSNTITNGEVLSLVRNVFTGPVLSYVHELQMSSLFYTSAELLNNTMQISDQFLTSCDAVKQNLVMQYGIEPACISRLNYYLPGLVPVEQNAVDAFKARNGIQASFVVAALATIDWRKGADVFIQVAMRLFRKHPGASVQFVWMGGHKDGIETKKMLFDIHNTGLEQKVIVIESSKAYSVIYDCINVLLLTSREDPFPLVVLEAASKSIPVVCFEKAGGAPELINGDAGATVPYLDAESMSDAIMQYYNNRALLELHGNNAKHKVAELYQDPDLIVAQLENVLEKISIT